ncbi:MAG: hypothetical protein QG622_1662 [Actinomycetota bacterium]|nr:hypothetical protein [Actinomycetota bacterium]
MSSVVLTRIEIDGFKTFKDFALDVPPFLVVLGQNASGKSNLFDAIAFLARLAQGESVMKAVRDDRAQLHELLHRDSSGSIVDAIRFAVELTGVVPTETVTKAVVRFEVDLRVPQGTSEPFGSSSAGALVIADERWFIAGPGADGDHVTWSQLTYTPVGETPEDEATSRRFPSSKAFRPDVIRSAEGERGVSFTNAVIGAARKQLAGWRVLAPEPSALRLSDGFDDDARLSPAGQHLPNALARIIAHTRRPDRPQGVLSDLAADLIDIVPDVVGLRVDDDQVRRLRTVLVRTRGRSEYSASAASDGTLRALALLVALRDPQENGLVCLEEPENGVYPHLLMRFIRRIQQWARDTESPSARQIIISSHSPTILTALTPPSESMPLRDDVIFLDLVSRTASDRVVSRVSRIRAVRTGAPLTPDVPLPVVSMAELDDFLLRGTP